MAASSSSSSSSGLGCKYDVFINFRGEDTRRGFVSHLYKALRQKPINTFIDAEDLRKGGRLSELLTAIRESMISIVVFSENYASSTWCLKELVEILECNHTKNQIVLPIFYQVDPSNIRKLKGSFAEAFAKHEGRSNVDVKEVQSWRSALPRATDFSGWDSKEYKDDAELIEKIVEDVFKKLIHISSSSSNDNGLVEMDSHMDNMHSLLYPLGVETNDVRIVGIWGMGGLGKTTIARAVYDEISGGFKACCFLENFKEGFMKHGKLHMQAELLLSISNNKVKSSDISSKGFQVMLKSLGQRKVLIVVDDVDELEQIEALLEEPHSFGGGSRIIITTRDSQLLSIADVIYNPKILSDSGALKLFRQHAFRKNQPTRDYDDLSNHVVEYAQGLPLALKVLGAFLGNKTIREWEDELEKIRKIPRRGIHDVLKSSFDGLDDKEKDIFLDIACFFKGMKKACATRILEDCGFHPHTGIRVLIDRALITVSWRGELEMHDSLEEMGREIVRQECIKEPGRRSRLWSYEDVHQVLTQNTATKAVESIIVDFWYSDWACLNAEAFVSMTQLRLLKISLKYSSFEHEYCEYHLIGPFKLPNLRYLSWFRFPLKSLPSNFQFKNLVELDMQCSFIDRLWEGTQTLEKLKFINLSYCEYLKETPDFTNVPNLERLILQSCIRLVEVHPSISTLTKLVLLDLNWCNELKILPSNIRMKSLKTFNLFGCLSLQMFPEISEVIEGLEELDLSRSKIKELHPSINNITGLSHLNLSNCEELKSLPSSIRMKSLKTLDLSNCSSLEMFPEILEVIEGIEVLALSGSRIKELPLSINNLTRLSHLNLKNCKELESLPSSIHMKSLKTFNLSGCSSLQMFPEISEVIEGLEELDLSWSKIKELHPSINNITGLSHLNLSNCKELKSLPSSIRQLKSLVFLSLSGCTKFEVFPSIEENMEGLRCLFLDGTSIKELSPWIEQLTGLRYLDLRNDKGLVEDVYRKLIDISSTSSKDNGLVDMDSHMHEMDLLLYPPGVETNNVRVVGIWGMGGLGKTTIAKAVYDEISCRFEAGCFLKNVKEGFMKQGELHMQTQLLSSISDNKVGSSDILSKGFQVMLKSLGQRKVLIVVDDVDKLEQIEALLGEQHSFGGGSRIIITSRDSQLLSIADVIYNPKTLSDSGALKLFRQHAFRNDQPIRDYDDLSNHVVEYAQGLPLALKVLGAFLHKKTIRVWEGELEKIRKIPQRGVHDVLKTSFDGLDDTQKDIFLDIACFFKGMKKDQATEILDSCGFHPHTGIKVLIDRALITVSRLGELEMHDSLEEMGREIVRQESIKDPGRRSRLWSYEDVRQVLTENTATKTVESIIVDFSYSDWPCLNVEAFVRMTQLRLLKFSRRPLNAEAFDRMNRLSFLNISQPFVFKDDYCKQLLFGSLKLLNLRYLSWLGFPLKSLPSNFQFENLVELDMQYSLIDRLWEGTQRQEKLKFINLSYCESLKETPDFTNLPNLERLIVRSCKSLVEVHLSISTLTNLVLLDLHGCNKLKILPSKICMRSLKTFNLSDCSSLEMFPEISEGMEELEELDLSGSRIKELPLSINNLSGLSHFNLKDCKELKILPSKIRMSSLKTFNLSGCSSLEMFPEISEGMDELEELNLSGSKIKELPLSINNLTGLSHFNLKDCKELKSLPSCIHMKCLKTFNLYGCSSLEMFPSILEGIEGLEKLNLSGSKIKELPPSINNLTGLCHLNLQDCKELKSLPRSIRMKSLKSFALSGCWSLEMFPEISEVIEGLKVLELSGSNIEELPSSINNLTGLNHLKLENCTELKSLPSSICQLKSLVFLSLSGCTKFEVFPSIEENMEGLRCLFLDRTSIKELSPWIERLTGLRYLDLRNGNGLVHLPDTLCNLAWIRGSVFKQSIGHYAALQQL